MIIDDTVKQYLEKSVLCWLATANERGAPNVSPKEYFCEGLCQPDTIIIANIASAKSIDNLKKNSQVCVSFIDIFEQLGYKALGRAKNIGRHHSDAAPEFEKLEQLAGPDLEVTSLMRVTVSSIEPISAPRYQLDPEYTVPEQLETSFQSYGVLKSPG
ncbi:MAG: pyridoxamine 5'-phosphate oxidase family protein [Cellvibrionaceae bacterium]|nr:pyridoxamine 5'-phosphate oxidase family protein [Cellvibrionaceae bacterium]MCV6627573.1 pyridoxamine 5'-phosphate oxidase family protein [Cellvibrionaceae bacterium]